MAADAPAAAPGRGPVPVPDRGDARWLFIIWAVLSIIGCLLVVLVLGPHLPPGHASNVAASQQVDIIVLSGMATPVVIGVLLYFGWALAFWRKRLGDETDAAPLHGNLKVQATWIIGTSVIVLALAVYGTVELIVPGGAGSGQGPQPIFKNGVTTAVTNTSWTPDSGNILQVQVIGQQWAWTYRYPQFGGFETTELVLPVGQQVQFNVTSLDVIHSFWAYTLGVKADANPGVNNVAYATPSGPGLLPGPVRRAVRHLARRDVRHRHGHDRPELHGVGTGHQEKLADVTKILPPYALTYDPTTIPAGKINEELA